MTKSGIKQTLKALLAGGLLAFAGTADLHAESPKKKNIESIVQQEYRIVDAALQKQENKAVTGAVLKKYPDFPYKNHIPFVVKNSKLLYALHMKESSGRDKLKPTLEKSIYQNIDSIARQDKRVAEGMRKYGKYAISCSYGPWQTTYINAVTLGFNGNPEDLSDPKISFVYFSKYLEKLDKKFDGNVAKIISAYNAGPGNVGKNPGYVKSAMKFYNEAPNTLYGVSSIQKNKKSSKVKRS